MEAYVDSLSKDCGMQLLYSSLVSANQICRFLPTKNNAELCLFWRFISVVILRDKSETFRVYQSKGTAGESTLDLK